MSDQQPDVELDDLRDLNAEYKERMQRLKRTIETEIKRHNHKRNKKKDLAAQSEFSERNAHVAPELRELFKQNEDLKRERTKLSAEFQHNDTGRRIAEVKNTVVVVDRQIRELKSEIKAMEGVAKSQKTVYETAKASEDEIKYIRDAHAQELAGFRQDWQDVQAEEKQLQRTLIAHQMRYHLTHEKIAHGMDGKQLEALRERVERQDEQKAELESQVSKASADVDRDQRKEQKEAKRLLREKEELSSKIDELKATLTERERELKLSYALHENRHAVKR